MANLGADGALDADISPPKTAGPSFSASIKVRLPLHLLLVPEVGLLLSGIQRLPFRMQVRHLLIPD